MFSKITPTKIIVIGYALIILTGTLLLTLPFATVDGLGAPFSDALFTATSATCVTGLVVHDTVQYWSTFGQLVLLSLIQVGGLGFITMAVVIVTLTKKKIGLKQRILMQESICAPQMGGIVRLTRFAVGMTFLLEGTGAFLLSFRFCKDFGFGRGVYYSIFHAISAFCNAGFDHLGKNEAYISIGNYRTDALVCGVIMMLIVVGGLGFFVWKDIKKNRFRFRRYSLQTKIVLTTTAVLIVLGTVIFMILEYDNPMFKGYSFFDKLLICLFQSVSPRTAGFAGVNLAKFTEASLFITIVLMLIGGSPGSTAGGMKTTTVAVSVFALHSLFKKQHNIQCFSRRIGEDVMRRSMTVIALYFVLFFIASTVISALEDIAILPCMFESASALGTVGLSMGITPELGQISRSILIALMYFGRVGGLTILFAVADKQVETHSKMPLENIAIG